MILLICRRLLIGLTYTQFDLRDDLSAKTGGTIFFVPFGSYNLHKITKLFIDLRFYRKKKSRYLH